MSLEEQVEKCSKIHDTVAQYWNWAYYDTRRSECSWLLGEYVKQIKPDVARRVPVMLEQMEELLQQYRRNSLSILDVGCGPGGFINRVAATLNVKYPDLELRASGIDISGEMITYAKKNLCDFNVELICDSITNQALKFQNEPFDVAIMMVTLSFYNDENAKDVLKAVRNKLKKDGRFLLMDFAWSYSWSGVRLFSKPLQKLADMLFSHILGEPFHFHNRTEDQLKALLKEVGFEVSQSYLTEKKSTMKGMIVIVAQKEATMQEPRLVGAPEESLLLTKPPA